MYVSYEDYATYKVGYVTATPNEQGEDNPEPKKLDITPEAYMRLAPLADNLIDAWTLYRVGNAVRRGDTLPESIVALYCAIIDGLPYLTKSSCEAGQRVASFSNGIDSFSFDLTTTAAEDMRRSLWWMVEALPWEWNNSLASLWGVVDAR